MQYSKEKWLATASAMTMAFFLSACAVGPDFEKPAAPVVKTYTAGSQLTKIGPTEGIGGAEQTLVSGKDIPAEWWSLFHSDALNKLIYQALVSNPDLQAAQASLREAQDNLYAGEGAFFPSITASGYGTRQKTSGNTYGSSNKKGSLFNLYNASVGVSYSLDLFGGTRRAVEALDAQATYERFQLEGAYLSLTSNIVTAALQEASLRAQIAATKDIVEAQRKQLEMVQKQLALGGVSRSAVLTQESTLAATEAGLPALEKQLSITRHLLSVLIGQFPSEEVTATFVLDNLTLPEELPLTLPSQLVEQRPDIQAAEALLHAASAQIGVATANMLPKITLSGDLGSSAQTMSNLLSPGGGLWSVMGSVAQPIFEGGSLYYKREASKDAFDAAAASYRSTVLTAFQEVADTLKALEMDSKSLKAQIVSEKAAAASLEIATKQFQTGSLSYLGLLTSQQAYQSAKIALVKAQATRFADTAALFQALGGGWWNRTDDATETDKAENKINAPVVKEVEKKPEAEKVVEPEEKSEPKTEKNNQTIEDGAKI